MTGNKIAIPLSGKSFKTKLRGMPFALLSCLPSSCQGVYQVSDCRERCVGSFISNSRAVWREVRPRAKESLPATQPARAQHGGCRHPASPRCQAGDTEHPGSCLPLRSSQVLSLCLSCATLQYFPPVPSSPRQCDGDCPHAVPYREQNKEPGTAGHAEPER